MQIVLRISIYGAKITKDQTPWYVLLDYFTTRPSFKNIQIFERLVVKKSSKTYQGGLFLVILALYIASIVNCHDGEVICLWE